MSQKASPTLIGVFTLVGLILVGAALVLFGAGFPFALYRQLSRFSAARRTRSAARKAKRRGRKAADDDEDGSSAAAAAAKVLRQRTRLALPAHGARCRTR